MPYTTQDIRNIALVGQAGAGKTLLAEALLAQSGAIRSKGSLARGTTVCDFDPQEKALLHSLDAAICGFETQGRRVNMIDTPGYPDFLGRTLSALEAVETAVIVVSAVNGIEPMTQRMMDFARTRGLCRLVVVNKIDARDARTEQVLLELREAFGKSCLPLNLPAEGGASVVELIWGQINNPLIWVLIGGIIGIILGWALAFGVGRIAAASDTPIEPTIGLDIVLLATLFSTAVGLFFGLYPANRAASLEPVEALRYE